MTPTPVVAVVATDGTGMTDDLTAVIGRDMMTGIGTGKPCLNAVLRSELTK